ncbi:MAG: transposase [Burkholderiaceae bacterium]
MDTIIQSAIGPAKRGRHRRHSAEFKRAVVKQSLTTGASVSRIAREHNVNANQVFAWRQLFKEGLLGAAPSWDCTLLPVTLADLPQKLGLADKSGLYGSLTVYEDLSWLTASPSQ